MSQGPSAEGGEHREHMSWVRTRMNLSQELLEWVRHGFMLITAGFGSFAFLEGLVGALGDAQHVSATEPSRIFSLIATAVGVLLIVIALRHHRKMVDFINTDEYGESEAPALPDETREEYLALGAIALGVVSFVALVFLR